MPTLPLTTTPSLPWLDWIPAASLQVRSALQLLRGDVEKALEWDEAALEKFLAPATVAVPSADTDRLRSRILQLRLARAPVPARELKAMEQGAGGMSYWPPEIQVHRETPPFFVTLAHAWLLLGASARALNILDRQNPAGLDDDARRFAEAEKLRIVRRLRRHDVAAELIKKKAESLDAREASLAWPLVRLLNPVDTALPLTVPGESASPALVHAWWQAQTTVSALGRKRAAALEGGRLGQAREEAFPTDRLLAFELSGDQVERMLLSVGMRDYPSGILPDVVKGLIKSPRLDDYSSADRWRALLRYNSVLRGPGRDDESSSDSPTAELVQMFERQPQAIAEWALEEGELAMLRSPLAGRYLLDHARRLFRGAGNPEHAFMAAVAGTLARVQSGHFEEAQECLEQQAAPRLAEIQSRNPNFPVGTRMVESREALAQWSKERRTFFETASRDLELALKSSTDPEVEKQIERALEENRLDRLDFEAWQPWLVRYVSAHFFIRAQRGDARDRLNWNLWALHQLQGGHFNPGAITLLPFELDLLVRSQNRRRWVVLLEQGLAWLRQIKVWSLAGVPLCVLVVWNGFNGHQSLPDHPTISAALALRRILILLLCAALLAYWLFPVEPRLWRKFQAWLAAKSAFHLRFRSGPPALAEDHSFRVTLEHSRVLRDDHRFSQQWVWPWQRRLELLVDEPWASLPKQPTAISAVLQKWATHLGRRRLPLSLETHLLSADVPWEAVLSELIAGDEAAKSRPLDHFPYRPYRWLPHNSSEARFSENAGGKSRRRKDPVLLVATRQWFPPLHKAWGGRAAAPAQVWPDNLYVLHLVGQPVSGRHGVRLRTELEMARDRYEANQSNAEASAAGALLGAPDLPLRTRSLLIVQAEPTQINRRLDSDREQTRRLRQFAAEMFQAGSAAVLLIPALPPRLAEETTQVLRRHVQRSRPGLRQLLDLTDELRVTVATWQSAAPDLARATNQLASATGPGAEGDLAATLREIAWEITLFARSRLEYFPLDPDPQISEAESNKA